VQTLAGCLLDSEQQIANELAEVRSLRQQLEESHRLLDPVFNEA